MRDQISDFQLDGRLAIVFGGGRGNGSAISLVLAEAGAASQPEKSTVTSSRAKAWG